MTQTQRLVPGGSQSPGEDSSSTQMFPKQAEGGRGWKMGQVQVCQGPGQGRIHLVPGLGVQGFRRGFQEKMVTVTLQLEGLGRQRWEGRQ